MERRTALAFAAAAGGTVLAATAAFVTNVGLLDTADEAPISVLDSSNLVGDETPLAQDPTVVTIVVEDPPARVAPAATPAPTAAATASRDDGYDDLDDDHGGDEDDDWDEDDDGEDDDRDGEDHEDEHEDDDDDD